MIDQISQGLNQVGWTAVGVNGYLPHSVFMQFHSQQILPITLGVRPLEHVAFSPDPDIFHEATGHAALVLEHGFANYLRMTGEMGYMAFSSSLDGPSEDEVLARLNWWTIECGMVGSIDRPRVFGAAILSSLAESEASVTDRVKKVKFDLDTVISTPYEISSPQSALFVFEDYEVVFRAAREVAGRMAWKTGGARGLQVALVSKQPATVLFSSGLEVAGTITDVKVDNHGEALYFVTSDDSDTNTLCAIGLLEGGIAWDELTPSQCRAMQLVAGGSACLAFESGLKIIGRVRFVEQKANRLARVMFDRCEAVYDGSFVALSQCDIVAGIRVVSVVPCRNSSGPESTSIMMANRYPLDLAEIYRRVRGLRTGRRKEGSAFMADVTDVARLLRDFQEDWLARLEILELLRGQDNALLSQQLLEELQQIVRQKSDDVKRIIWEGIEDAGTSA